MKKGLGRHRPLILGGVALGLVALTGLTLMAWDPKPVKEDPLVRMPGTQPGQVTLEGSNRCLNCHDGYDPINEIGSNWMGSMMAQSARDFLFWACMTVSAQDAIWQIGNPNATDLCMRCHFPKGWLEGRSDPTNATAMTGADFNGIQCDFCHKMYDPFFEDTWQGTREGNDWAGYWDESNLSATPSQPAADETHDADWLQGQTLTLFNGLEDFYGTDKRPFSANYTEAGSGQYFISGDNDKRASFADAEARHRMLYSRFHKSKYFCATCHDVSNPALANLGADPTQPLPTETDSAFSYYHVERTFSEFMLSAYGEAGGADGKGPYAPSSYNTSLPGDRIGKCQDCHMQDVTAMACNKKGAPMRPDESADSEHPKSGMPRHDLTGGNIWVPWVLASSVPDSPVYDAFNDTKLNQGAAVLTLDLTQGMGLDPVALLDGVDRAKKQLRNAATIETDFVVESQTIPLYDPDTGKVRFRLQNNTGHKLISGFPEGRRMWINIRAYDGVGALIHEVNPYDGDDPGEENGVHTLKGLGVGSSPALDPNEVYESALVYETHPESDLTNEHETFHFVLATGRYKDNRIPPKGFRIAEAAARLCTPVWDGVDDPNYFTAAEYAGGYDEVDFTITTGATTVEVKLYYQTTSREYIEFLRDEINGTASTLWSPTPSGEPEAYIAQTDPFFDQLAAWGNTIWDLWDHNKTQAGAAPFLMADATYGDNATQPNALAGVTLIRTGKYRRGAFVETSTFAPGDEIVFRCTVEDDATPANPVVGALVNLHVAHDQDLEQQDLGPSPFTDADGITDLRWKTVKPKGKNAGTPTGAYTATVTGVTANNYDWDGEPQPTAFTIQ